MRLIQAWLVAVSAALASGVAAAQDPPAAEGLLKQVQTIDLGGVQGRIDHLAMDAAGKRLVVAALGNGTLEVIDPAEGIVLKSVEKLDQPAGVAYLPDGRLAVTSSGAGVLHLVDTSSYTLDSKIAVGSDADNVRIDGTKAWVGYGNGALALLETAEKPRKMTEVKLEGHPESFQLETKGKRIFVNVPAAKHVAVIDRDRRAVVAKWPLEAGSNYPMALDEDGKRLFVGCRSPAKLLVVETEKGKTVASCEIAKDCDDVWWDAAAKRVYVSCGEGFVDVVAPKPDGTWERTHQVATAQGARTCLFVAATGRLYVAVQRGKDSPGAEIRVFSTR